MKKFLLGLFMICLCVACHMGTGISDVSAEGIAPKTVELKELIPKSLDIRNKSSTQVCAADVLSQLFIGNINSEEQPRGLDPTSPIGERVLADKDFHSGLDCLRADGTEMKTADIARSFSGNVRLIRLLSG